MTRSNIELLVIPYAHGPLDRPAPGDTGRAPTHIAIISSPSGSGRSTLDLYLKAKGGRVIAGPVHTDGPEDFAQAQRAAHSVEECLPTLHDTVLEATGKSLADDELRMLVAQLPKSIADQIEEWGPGDTEVNTQIYHHLKRVSGVACG